MSHEYQAVGDWIGLMITTIHHIPRSLKSANPYLKPVQVVNILKIETDSEKNSDISITIAKIRIESFEFEFMDLIE